MTEKRSGLRAVPLPILGLAVLLVLALGARFALAGDEALAHHPDPRRGVTDAEVVPAATFAAYPGVAAVYDEARGIPEILDGLYCHCDCSLHAGHRSLLSCFESDHGAGCDVCLAEAHLAHQMATDGARLKEIRQRVDALFGA